MRDFLSFVKERETIKLNETFIQKDAEKAVGLIKTLLRKHIDSLVAIEGYANTTVGQEKCTTKYFIVPKSGHDVMFTMSWLSTEGTSQVYSIDFFDDTDLLWYGRSRSKLSLFTCGSSVAYFLPVIWNVVNSGDWSLSEKDARKYGEVIYGKVAEGSVEHPHYIGAQAYTVIENLSDRVIHDATVLAEAADAQLDSYVAGKRREKTQAWYGVYGGKDDVTQEDRDRFNKLTREYNEITAAINGGAQTISDLRMAIKRNVSVIDELNKIYGEDEKKFDKDKEELIKSRYVKPAKLEKVDLKALHYVDMSNPEEVKNMEAHAENVFNIMFSYEHMVATGKYHRGLLLCGAPGMGKTDSVGKEMIRSNISEDNKKLKVVKAMCTPPEMYKILYEYRNDDQIIVVDDVTGLIGPDAKGGASNLLKAALNSGTPGKPSRISWQVSKNIKNDIGDDIPKEFDYYGRIIFITNWGPLDCDEAVRSRCLIMDIQLTLQEILYLIKKNMPEMDPVHLSVKAKEKAYNYLFELVEELIKKWKETGVAPNVEISFRTFKVCAKIFQSQMDDDYFTEDIAKMMIKEQLKYTAKKLK